MKIESKAVPAEFNSSILRGARASMQQFESSPHIAKLRAATDQYEALPLTPAVLPGETVRQVERVCQLLFMGLSMILQRAFRGDIVRLASYLRLSPIEFAGLRIPPEYPWAVLARPDIIINGSQVTIVETNMTGGLGGIGVGELVTRAQLDATALAPHLDKLRHPWDSRASIAKLFCHLVPELRDGALLVLVDWPEHFVLSNRTRPWYYDFLVGQLREVGINASSCSVDDLQIDRTAVTLGGTRVCAINRFFEPPLGRDSPSIYQFMNLVEAVSNRAVHLIDDFRGLLLGSKIMLALLTDDRFTGVLPGALAQELAAHIPWTRIVEDCDTTVDGHRVSLLDWAHSHKNDLVLKPGRGFNGINVVVGRDTTQPGWLSSLDGASAQSDEVWLLQRFVEPETLELPQVVNGQLDVRAAKTVYGAFMMGGRLRGLLRRNSTSKTHGYNVTRTVGVSSVVAYGS